MKKIVFMLCSIWLHSLNDITHKQRQSRLSLPRDRDISNFFVRQMVSHILVLHTVDKKIDFVTWSDVFFYYVTWTAFQQRKTI